MRRALQLIIYAARPVTVEEVAEAVITEVGQDSLDIESRLHHPGLLLAICGSLVSFNDGEPGLAHYSVQEYLTSERIQHGPAREFAMTETKAAFEISAICLTYLGFTDFNIGPCSPADIKFRQHRFPFLTYAALNWFVHAVQSLHFGAVQVLLQNGADCNEVSDLGSTALYFAVRESDPMMVYLLLEHGADPSPIPGYRTPSCAVKKIWFDSIVEILRQSRASITTLTDRSIQALDDDTITRLDRIVEMLSSIVLVGHEPMYFKQDHSWGMIVEMLLWYGWDRDSPNKNSSDQPRYPVACFEVPGSWTRIAETLRVFPKIAFTPTTHQRVTQTPGDARLQDKWGDELDN